MGNSNESRLRDTTLDADEKKTPVDPDNDIRLDGEKDTLYDDGLEVEDDSETYADTHGNKMPR